MDVSKAEICEKKTNNTILFWIIKASSSVVLIICFFLIKQKSKQFYPCLVNILILIFNTAIVRRIIMIGPKIYDLKKMQNYICFILLVYDYRLPGVCLWSPKNGGTWKECLYVCFRNLGTWRQSEIVSLISLRWNSSAVSNCAAWTNVGRKPRSSWFLD